MTKCKFNFAHVNGWWKTYYSPQGDEMPELYAWCHEMFGSPWSGDRWNYHGGWLNFRNEEDVMWFKLRWA